MKDLHGTTAINDAANNIGILYIEKHVISHWSDVDLFNMIVSCNK